MPTHNLKLLILVSIYRRHYHNFYVVFFTAAYVCIQLGMNLVSGYGDSLWSGTELLWGLPWPLFPPVASLASSFLFGSVLC